jgi:hypothetical protein
MTYYKEAFIEYNALQELITILTANGIKLQVIKQGTIILKVPRNGTVSLITLIKVLYALGLIRSLISVSQL